MRRGPSCLSSAKNEYFSTIVANDCETENVFMSILRSQIPAAENSIDCLSLALELERDTLTSVTIRSCARRILVNAARHIVGGYYMDSPEERAVEQLLKLAQEIEL